MSEFRTGDFVVTPSGRIAKVNRFWEESRRDDCARVDLTYIDGSKEQVRLSPELLTLHQGPAPDLPERERKARNDYGSPRQQVIQAGDIKIPALKAAAIRAQLLQMSGCLKAKVIGRAGGLASSKKRRTLQ